ncbi:MAG: DNA-processing protein DprA [Candidatus Aminicenantes bacterium]|nr:DNA-processing protein DprA [Candidatus Aminicenantes bacterium]
MNTVEGKAWRILANAKEIGPRTLWRIADYLAQEGKPASWLLRDARKIEDLINKNRVGAAKPVFFEQPNGEATQSGKGQITVIYPLHPGFPPAIKILKDEFSLPALLYVWGNMAILSRPAVAIIGRRNAGKGELEAAAALASELASHGVNVVSGYAAGIDTAAHLAALRANGTTSVILAEGICRFQAKPELKDHLTADNTLVISQFTPDARWAAYMAMTRNKLIGALSGALVVIASGPERDAGKKNSGTFNAAISSLKMRIPVFVAVPSFFSDPPAGNGQLIAKGGRAWDPAEGAEPVLTALSSLVQKTPGQLPLFPEE